MTDPGIVEKITQRKKRAQRPQRHKKCPLRSLRPMPLCVIFSYDSSGTSRPVNTTSFAAKSLLS